MSGPNLGPTPGRLVKFAPDKSPEVCAERVGGVHCLHWPDLPCCDCGADVLADTYEEPTP